MSEQREQRNDAARRRLAKAAPALPAAVLQHALTQRRIPQLPRLAVESYWGSHPVRADVLARALAARSGTPDGWQWGANTGGPGYRLPPAPYREEAHARGAGFCCLCGQPVFALGWHSDFTGRAEPNRRASWHACCVTAWRLWTAPNRFRVILARRQNRRCAKTGRRLLKSAEIDHRVPLFEVWRHHRDTDWPELLPFWGVPNLQALSLEAHQAKSIAEAASRRPPSRNAAAPYPSARVNSPDWRFSGRGMPTILNPAST